MTGRQTRSEAVAEAERTDLLWRLESVLAEVGTQDCRCAGQALHRYLRAMCEHLWRECEGDDDIPAHKQCLRCNEVIWHETALDFTEAS